MAEDPLARAKAIALRYLAAAPRTEAQVRARLAKADLEGDAEPVVGWLRRLGYLDDAAFARARARALLGRGRAGPRLAERRLLTAGVPAADARAAVSSALSEEAGGELALCRALAEKRARGVAPADLDARARARLARFLLGRGFAGSVVARVVGAFEDAD